MQERSQKKSHKALDNPFPYWARCWPPCYSATFSYSSFAAIPPLFLSFPSLFSLLLLQILEICLLLSVAFSIGYAIYLWIEKYWSGAIIFTILAVISVICYFPMRRRIPLSKLLLQFVFKIAGEWFYCFYFFPFPFALQNYSSNGSSKSKMAVSITIAKLLFHENGMTDCFILCDLYHQHLIYRST